MKTGPISRFRTSNSRNLPHRVQICTPQGPHAAIFRPKTSSVGRLLDVYSGRGGQNCGKLPRKREMGPVSKFPPGPVSSGRRGSPPFAAFPSAKIGRGIGAPIIPERCEKRPGHHPWKLPQGVSRSVFFGPDGLPRKASGPPTYMPAEVAAEMAPRVTISSLGAPCVSFGPAARIDSRRCHGKRAPQGRREYEVFRI